MSELKFEFKGVDGQLAVYDDKIVIERKGFFGVGAHGLSGAKTIAMSTIQAVQFKKAGLTNGFLEFTVLGSIEQQGGLFASAGENTIIVSKKGNEMAEKIKDFVEEKILERSKPQGTVVQQASAADELKKFKDLMDSGIITQEEFDAKKKQLLGL